MTRTYLGLDAKVYVNTTPSASATWSECDIIRDLNLGLEKAEADVGSRASAFELLKGARKRCTLEGQVLYDPTDANWQILNDSFWDGDVVQVAVMDSDMIAIPTGGSANGVLMDIEVMKWDQPQNLDEALVNDFTFKPTRSENEPAPHTVNGPT